MIFYPGTRLSKNQNRREKLTKGKQKKDGNGMIRVQVKADCGGTVEMRMRKKKVFAKPE